MRIDILPEIKNKLNYVSLGTITCKVENTVSDNHLWEYINAVTHNIHTTVSLPEIKNIETIKATRHAYKTLGKDPNRYRPSAEALHRRIIRGIGLYKVSSVVDVINLVSLQTGFSIGAFDAARINGQLSYGIGKANEKYEGIGRGLLNIEGLPVLRDEISGIGTPTSDETRTAITVTTKRLFVNINNYLPNKKLIEAINLTIEHLTHYCKATDVTVKIIE